MYDDLQCQTNKQTKKTEVTSCLVSKVASPFYIKLENKTGWEVQPIGHDRDTVNLQQESYVAQ